MMNYSTSKQAGFGLISALLALMVMGVVTVYMTQVGSFFSSASSLSQKMSTKQKMAVLRDLLIQTAKDIDNDQYYELLKPTVDNKIPATVSLSSKDEFGTDFRYCAYDLGVTNTIDVVNYVSNNPALSTSHISGRIISAGADKIFQTTCSDASTSGDDQAVDITEHDIRFTNGGLGGWKDEGTNISSIVTTDNIKLKTNLLTIGNFDSLPTVDPEGNAIETGTLAYDSSKDTYYAYTLTGWRILGAAPVPLNPGLVPVPATVLPDGTSVPAFNVFKYEAKQSGTLPVSTAERVPWASVHYDLAVSLCQSAGYTLISDNQWLAIAHNAVQQASNWTTGTVGSGAVFSGHNDGSPGSALAASDDTDGYAGTGNSAPSNQRRTLTLSNGSVVWDMAGNLWEWTSETIPIASRYHGGAANLMSYNTDDGTGKVATNVPVNKLPPAPWNANNGMGRYYDGGSTVGAYNNVSGYCSGYCDSQAAFLRGGRLNGGGIAGLFDLYLNNGRAYTTTLFGFRCTSN